MKLEGIRVVDLSLFLPGPLMTQFMADHGYNQPGGYAYHHCADLQITADPAKPIDTRWPGQATTSK